MKALTDMNLFELEAEFKELDDAYTLLAEAPTDADDELEAALRMIQEQQAQLESAFQKKAEGWGRVYLLHRRLQEPIASELKRLQALKKSHETVADRVRKTLHTVMESLGLAKVHCETLSLSVCKNGGRPAVTHDGDTPVPLDLAGTVALDPEQLLDGFWSAYRRVRAAPEEPPAPAALLAFLGVDVATLTPDPEKVLKHLDQTGEVPCGFTIQRGTHLRIG